MASASISERPSLAGRPKRVSVQELLDAFEGKIKRVRVPIIYRFGLLITAVLMVLLPLMYLALVGGVGYGLFYHAVNNFPELDGSRSSRGAFAVYLLPFFVGAIMLFFMVKPLLAPRGGYVPPRYLKPEDQPVLYAFVGRLCEIVRAPKPSRIGIDCQVNASAGPSGGLFSLLIGRLTLTIGMPLASGLDLRQLTGILAHEFGHFGQGGAMTLTYLIRRTNGWFARVVYERDAWDEWLEEASKGGDPRVMIIFLFARVCIWASRRVLWVLMWAGHFFSCFMLRQMEFDADRYEARIGGSEIFGETTRNVILLSAAWQKTIQDLSHAMEEKRLGDDLPAMIAANAGYITAEDRGKIIDEEMKTKTGFFDTHPASALRISKAAREKTEGIFRDERPAAILFRDYEDLCKQVTMDFYAEKLGREIVRAQLCPTAEIIARQKATEASTIAASRYSLGMLIFGQTVVPETTDMKAPADPKACMVELHKHRERLRPAAKILGEAIGRFKEAETRAFKVRVAEELMQAKLSFAPGDFGMRRRSPEEVKHHGDAAGRLREDALTELHPFIFALRMRMRCALQLLYMPQVRQRLTHPDEMIESAERLVRALRAVEGIEPACDGINASLASLGMLLKNVKGRENDENYIKRIKSLARRAHDEIEKLHGELKYSPYPFSTAGQADLSIGEYLIGHIPLRDDIGDIFNVGGALLDRCNRFYFRAMGAVALIAEQVETAIGLPPLEGAVKNQAAAETN